MRRGTRLTALALTLIPLACWHSRVPKDAEVVFDVDFSAPEQTAGSVVKIVDPGKLEVWPSRLPSTIFFGHPTVVHDLCGLDKQPLRISAATGDDNHEGVNFSLDPRWGRYHVELDLCIDSVNPQGPNTDAPIVVFLDIINAHAIGFNPDGQVTALAPPEDAHKAGTPQPVGTYQRKKPMHLAVDVDFEKKTWRIALDGKVLVADSPVVTSVPGAVRVMVRNNAAAVIAIDNVLIWGQDDRFAGQEDDDLNGNDAPDSSDSEQ